MFSAVSIVRFSLLDGLQETSRRQNGYPAERIEGQQVLIAAYQIVGFAADREFEKLIVFWIAAFPHRYGRFNQLRPFDECLEELFAIIGGYVSVELFAPQDFGKLFQGRRRHENLAVLQRLVESLPWRGMLE